MEVFLLRGESTSLRGHESRGADGVLSNKTNETGSEKTDSQEGNLAASVNWIGMTIAPIFHRADMLRIQSAGISASNNEWARAPIHL